MTSRMNKLLACVMGIVFGRYAVAALYAWFFHLITVIWMIDQSVVQWITPTPINPAPTITTPEIFAEEIRKYSPAFSRWSSEAYGFLDVIAIYMEGLYLGFRWTHLIAMVVLLVPTYLMVRWAMRFCIRMLKLTSMKIRGVNLMCSYGEALRAGSIFRVGKPPKGQVEVRIPGIFMPTHSGYGIRIGDVLVLNDHEIDGIDYIELANIDENGMKKILMPTGGKIKSPLLNDIVYLMLDPKAWTTLGTAKAKPVRMSDIGRYVSCYGKEGVSTGTLVKTSIVGQVVYSGSTIPGMSGAAYHLDGHVYGIHNGVMSTLNVGYAMDPIVADIKLLFGGQNYQAGEVSPGAQDKVREQLPTKKVRRTWVVEDLDTAYAKMYKPHVMSVEEQEEVDDIWAAAARKGRGDRGETAFTPGQQRVLEQMVRVNRQSDNGKIEDVPLLVLEEDKIDDKIEKIEETEDFMTQVADTFKFLIDRIEELELRMKTMETAKNEQPVEDGEVPYQAFKTQPSQFRREYVQTTSYKGPQEKVAAMPIQKQPFTIFADKKVETAQVEYMAQNPDVKRVVTFTCGGDCGVVCKTKERLIAHQSASHPVRVYTCDCGVKCRTEQRLANHAKQCKYTPQAGSSHQPESTRIFSDNTKNVKLDRTNFLGPRSNSPKTKSKTSQNNSKSQRSNPPSPSQAELLSAILTSQLSMQKSLADLAKVMAGPSSAAPRN